MLASHRIASHRIASHRILAVTSAEVVQNGRARGIMKIFPTLLGFCVVVSSLVGEPVSAQWAHLDDANEPVAPPPSALPSFEHHQFPRTLMHELQGPTTNAEYGKYHFIDGHGSVFQRVEDIQSDFSSDTMLLRHISARAYQGFGANFCRISTGIAFESTGSVTQGGPESVGCDVFAGHWLYKAGTTLAEPVTAQAEAVRVVDPSRLVPGQYVVIYDAPAGSFRNAEHAEVVDVDNGTGMVSLRQRGFKSTARARVAGAIIATHMLGQGTDPQLWAFNTSTQCPVDGDGDTFGSFYAKWLQQNYDRYHAGTRTTANLAGILFDADIYFELDASNADYNNDLDVDNGISAAGVNWQGEGLDEFYAATRALLPNLHILTGMHDGRGYESNNGLQMESWLDIGNADYDPNPQYRQLNSMFAFYLFNMAERGIKPPLVHNLTKTPTRLYSGGKQTDSNAPFRLALAMTLMEDGYFGTHSNQAGDAWWDEFAVDVDSGSPNYGEAVDKSNLRGIAEHRGWLGQPLGKFFRVYDGPAFAPSESLLGNGSFDGSVNNWVAVNTTISASANAFEGSGALKASFMRSYTRDPSGTFLRSEQIALDAGTEYTIAFTARASAKKDVRVILGSFNEKMPIGENWRRYVMSFRQSGNANSALRFQLGREDSEFWVDSVYVFAGSANLLRRDFQNGIALANATPLAKTVELGGEFLKISGAQDPDINDGSRVTSLTLAPYDGVLLVRPDESELPPPPAAGRIGDLVWFDENGDGIRDATEIGEGGVAVNLYDCANTLVKSSTTDGNGQYLFQELPVGEYVVEFVAPDGKSLSPALQGEDWSIDSNPDPKTGRTGCLAMAESQVRLGIDAGLVSDDSPPPPPPPPPSANASLGDFVWLDANENGIQDDGEPGVQGVAIDLLDCTGVLIKSSVSDTAGVYKFDELPPGDYRLGFEAPEGMRLTRGKQGGDLNSDSDPAESNGMTECVSLGEAEVLTAIDAGLVESKSDDDTPEGSDVAKGATAGAGGGGAVSPVWLVCLLFMVSIFRRRSWHSTKPFFPLRSIRT